MTIEISEETRRGIASFQEKFRAAIESFSDKVRRSSEISGQELENRAVPESLRADEKLSDKIVQQIVVCRERASILSERARELAQAIARERPGLISLATEASDLLRNAVGKQLFSAAEEGVKASLPSAIAADSHMVFKIWHEGAEKHRIAQFLNPRPLSFNDDPESNIEESSRRNQILTDLLEGRDLLPVVTA